MQPAAATPCSASRCGTRVPDPKYDCRMPSDAALPLSGRCVLVTGASSGIGRAIALAAARHGADVAVTYHANERGALDVVGSITAMQRRSAAFEVDLASEGSIRALPAAARAALG